MKRKSSNFLHSFILQGILFIFLLTVGSFPLLAEIWTRAISRLYQSILGPIVNFLPFSLMEFFFLFLYGWMLMTLISIVKALKRKAIQGAIHDVIPLLIFLLSSLNLYVGTAGIAYNRAEVPIPQYQAEVDYRDYSSIVVDMVDSFNDLIPQLTFNEQDSVVNPYTFNELQSHMIDEFTQLEDTYYTRFTPMVKSMWSSWLYREFHITGVHFAPSTEAMINTLIPNASLPFTMAHEIAHAKGVMREEDANLVAMYITLQSEDPFIRYSGFHSTIYSVLNLMRYVGDASAYSRAVNTLHPNIRKDFQYGSTYWQEHDGLNTFATWINDTYLKLFGQKDGVNSYVDQPVIDTVIVNGEAREIITSFSPYQKLYFYFNRLWR
jgi:hypothetical protein